MGRARDRGLAGERLAAAYLEYLGLDLLASNVKLAGVEVDLVARDGRTVVLVEVKTRERTDFGGAVAAIDARKQERLRRASRAVMKGPDDLVRIDVITVEPEDEGVRIRHYVNAITD